MAKVSVPVQTLDLISSTDELSAFCKRLASDDFVTVDTEFLREKTYWPKLCLVQVAGSSEARMIDALADGIDLAPLFELMTDQSVMKVFHAARQDAEIFLNLSGNVPTPIFDTQIAAMVCGFGEQVGYETLVNKLAKANIDKSSRFTDWSARPLTEKQLTYALSDVTHLRVIYEKLLRRVERDNRMPWLAEEIDIMTDPATYVVEPEDAWARLKIRSRQPKFLNVARELAAWREREAQNRDMPRNRILRDEALLEIASSAPTDAKVLSRTRGLSESAAHGKLGTGILEAVKAGLAVPPEKAPEVAERASLPRGIGPITDLLRVLLKHKCEEWDVAQKLIANSADLDEIAADDNADVAALRGWRREIFGEDALALKRGDLGIYVDGKKIRLIERH